MGNASKKIIVRFGAKGFLFSSPLVLFMAGLTALFKVMSGNDYYILLALTIVATLFWIYYLLRLQAVYENEELVVRRPFGRRLLIKEQRIAFVRKNRRRFIFYDKDGNELVQIFTYMNNAELLVATIEDRANERIDKRVLNVSEYIEPLNTKLKLKCYPERFELTRAIDKSAKVKKGDKHNIDTESAENDSFSSAEAQKSGENEGELNEATYTPVLRLVNKNDPNKRILFYSKGRETHLKFMNASVVLSTSDSLDEAVQEVFEIVEDIITSKIVTVCITDARNNIINSRAFYRKKTDRKAIKDAKLNKAGARVCAWNDKAAKDFLSRNF